MFLSGSEQGIRPAALFMTALLADRTISAQGAFTSGSGASVISRNLPRRRRRLQSYPFTLPFLSGLLILVVLHRLKRCFSICGSH